MPSHRSHGYLTWPIFRVESEGEIVVLMNFSREFLTFSPSSQNVCHPFEIDGFRQHIVFSYYFSQENGEIGNPKSVDQVLMGITSCLKFLLFFCFLPYFFVLFIVC